MGSQLDILALEPFYGGARKAMLSALMRSSRHRWTLLKLPPRRIERRLSAAANWFAEHLWQHFSGHVDVLFTSEAMNLANLLRLVPDLASRPSVVYFHENHLPDVGNTIDGPFDLIDLNTATVATEVWFNSTYHLKTFLDRGAALVRRHPELAVCNPMPPITAKAKLIRPPLDLSFLAHVRIPERPQRSPEAVFIETRNADLTLLNSGLRLAHERGRRFRLITVGPVEGLSDDWERQTIKETEEGGQVAGLLEAQVFLSARPAATSDYLAMRAALAGCRLLVPAGGVYAELMPAGVHSLCLYNSDPQSLAAQLTRALDADAPATAESDWRQAFRAFDAISACRIIDERLEQLVGARTAAQVNEPD